MSKGNSPTLWIYDHAPTRWVIVGVFVVAWFLAIVFLFSDIVKVLVARPWWEDFIVVLATVAVPILAYLELLHSAEANRLRDEANEERRKANRLTEQPKGC
jgi:nicotinamide riboside transporter PnuC